MLSIEFIGNEIRIQYPGRETEVYRFLRMRYSNGRPIEMLVADYRDGQVFYLPI